MKIQQARFSRAVKFFEKGFCDRWKMDAYHEPYAPCFFAGVYKHIGHNMMEDVNFINNHKGLKVIWNTRWNDSIKEVFAHINPENVVVCVGMGIKFGLPGYKVKNASFEIKDFSMFQPNKLGGSVYCYINQDARKQIYGYDTVERIKRHIKYPVIYGMLGNEMSYVKKNYYDNCFVNLKLDTFGAITSATELAFMGRRSISNADMAFCDPFQSDQDIIDLINKESAKIGTVQPSQIGDYFNAGDEWQNVDFWL